MIVTDVQSSWLTVFALFERFEDGLALMSLFESSSGDLWANGRPLTDILDGVLPSERAVAAAIAARMRRLFQRSAVAVHHLLRSHPRPGRYSRGRRATRRLCPASGDPV